MADEHQRGRGAELLFQVLTEREERSAIAIASNEPDGWTKTFTDPRLCVALVDRVTFNAHIIETGTQSYRLRTSKTSNRPQASELTQPPASGRKVNRSPPANPAKTVVFGGVSPASRTSNPVQANGAQ